MHVGGGGCTHGVADRGNFPVEHGHDAGLGGVQDDIAQTEVPVHERSALAHQSCSATANQAQARPIINQSKQHMDAEGPLARTPKLDGDHLV